METNTITHRGIKIYEVSGIVPKQYENEIAGGDSERLKNFATKSKAFAFAKKESKKNKWWEVEVRFMNDFELEGHWYFKNGVLTWDMAV
jgi:hypothetical protein